MIHTDTDTTAQISIPRQVPVSVYNTQCTGVQWVTADNHRSTGCLKKLAVLFSLFMAPIKATEMVFIRENRGDPAVHCEYNTNSERYTQLPRYEQISLVCQFLKLFIEIKKIANTDTIFILVNSHIHCKTVFSQLIMKKNNIDN